MKVPLRLIDYLQHILHAARRIGAKTDGMSKEGFVLDADVQDTAIRHIEIIGEASHNITVHYPEFAAEHPDLQLTQAYLMRNRLSHGYFEIN